MPRRVLGLCIATIAAAACSPTFDWREARPPGSGALAMFPCRPASHSRDVRLAGAPVRMSIHACNAGKAVFALAHADVGDPMRAGAALIELKDAAVRNIGAQAPASSAFTVPGTTPNPHAQLLHMRGKRPDGVAIDEQIVLFTFGSVVYQATVMGEAIDEQAAETFFRGLALGR